MGSSQRSGHKRCDLRPRCEFEDTDFMDDVRLYRRLKRRKMMVKSSKTNKSFCKTGSVVDATYADDAASAQEDLVDEEYQEFLNCALRLQDEMDDMDPDYKMFRDNLKAHGSYCVLEIMIDGELQKVRYAMEGDPSFSRETAIYSDMLRACGLKNDAGGSATLRNDSTRSKMQKPANRGRMKEKNVSARVGIERLGVSARAPSVKRSKGKVSMENGVEAHTKKSNVGGEIVSKAEKKRSVVKDKHQFHTNNRSAVSVKKSKRKESVRHDERTQNFKSSLTDKEVSNKKDEKSNYRPAARVCHSSKSQGVSDERYSEHLFETDDKNMIFKIEGVDLVRYDATPDRSESSSDSEVVVLDSDPYKHGNTPFTAKNNNKNILDCDDEDNIPRRLYEDSEFSKGLMETLQAPYDEDEYKDLMLNMSRKRNKAIARELRGGRRAESVYDNVFYDSYLEQHSDLKEKLDQFSKPHKALFLMRGFFYWLEHSPLEGSFRPWMDDSCLDFLSRM